MHFKRKKTKRCVRCTICTKHRWKGNSASKKRISDLRNKEKADEQQSNT